MTNLIARDNFFRDPLDFRKDFDLIFNRFLNSPSAQEESTMTTAGFSPAVESFIDEEGEKFHCQITPVRTFLQKVPGYGGILPILERKSRPRVSGFTFRVSSFVFRVSSFVFQSPRHPC